MPALSVVGYIGTGRPTLTPAAPVLHGKGSLMAPMSTEVGTVNLVCPECEETIPSTYTTRVIDDPESPTGESAIVSRPDTTEFDAHMATHSGS